MSFVVCSVTVCISRVVHFCRNTNLQKVCSSSWLNDPVVKLLYSCRTSVFHTVSHPGWLAEQFAAKRFSLLKFCTMTGSAVALHCGKAHLQSQWERTNFDPNYIKIPEFFSNLNLTSMIRSLGQCKFAIQVRSSVRVVSSTYLWVKHWVERLSNSRRKVSGPSRDPCGIPAVR